MEDGLKHRHGGSAAASGPPPPPEPSAAAPTSGVDPAFSSRSDEPFYLNGENWDIEAISALGALRMLMEALQTLADAMGDIPPTPPVSRPTTPRKQSMADEMIPLRRTSSPEASSAIDIGSPIAAPHEPITVSIAPDAEDINIQRIAIARRFFSKTAPAFSLSEYLLRLHHWCPHSPGVYLTAASYIHRLSVTEVMVPATNRTIHRLALAGTRVAAKAVEDNKWTQDRIAKVGGVSKTQLLNLEVTLCFLLDFDLGVNSQSLARGMFGLQNAARLAGGARKRLSDNFMLKLPASRRKSSLLMA